MARTPNKIEYLATWTDEELSEMLTGVDLLRSFDDTRAVLGAVIQLYRALRDHHVEETTELWARIRDLREQFGEGETVPMPHGHRSEVTADGHGAFCVRCGETLG